MLFFTWWKLCRITSPQPWLCIFKRVLLSLYVYIYIYFFFSDLHFAQTYQKLHKETRKLQQTHHSFLPMVACYWLSCIRTVRKLTLTKRNQLDDRPYWDFMFLQVLIFSFFFLFFLFFFLCLFRAVLAAYGNSQARGRIGAAAAGLHHSHGNARSKLDLRLIPQLTATPKP